MLPPGYGGADEMGDKLVALLRHSLHVTVCHNVLYVVDVSWMVDDTAPTEELLGVINTVDWCVFVTVEVT